jgi:cytochrome c biogenesis protein CcmG/thiol:disulfide interchange protein DsbE
MTSRQQWTITLGVLVAIAGGLALGTRFLKRDLFPRTLGVKAPDFTAQTIDSVQKSRKLSDYKGQVVLLNIWATWCGPCVREMPSIEALQKDMGPKGLKIVAVSIDDASAIESVRNFVQFHHLTFDILHDPSGQVQTLYRATGIPETFIIGRDGTIRKKVNGSSNWFTTANRELVTQLLAEPAP